MLTLSKGEFSLLRKFHVRKDLHLAGFAYANKLTSDVLNSAHDRFLLLRKSFIRRLLFCLRT